MIASGRSANQTLSGIDSFTDVMRYGTIEQKRAVLMLLARRFRPEFAPALKLALPHANPAIRVPPPTATAEIESGFTDRTTVLAAAPNAASHARTSNRLNTIHYNENRK